MLGPHGDKRRLPLLGGVPMTRKLNPVRCCYCGREFVPKPKKLPDETEEFFSRVVNTMQELLDDDLPVECGECREATSTRDGFFLAGEEE